MIRRALIVTLGSLLAVVPLSAQQQFPTLERGLNAGGLYQFAGIDNVNVFNGNLTISIPIGQAYPVENAPRRRPLR